MAFVTDEMADFIDELDDLQPEGAVDLLSGADDEIRQLKHVLKTTFPNFTGAVTATDTEINNLVAGGVGLQNVVEDLTPQSGGAYDTNGFPIVSVGALDVTITPDTTGSVVLDGLSWPQADGTVDQVLKTDGAGQLSFTDQSAGGTGESPLARLFYGGF